MFISDFWDEFCSLLGVKLKLSSAAHPQTDGQTEVLNQHMAQRLRPYVSYYQDDWSEYLPMVDFAAAVLTQESTGMSPFTVECGYEPRTSFNWRPVLQSAPVSEKANRTEAQQWIRVKLSTQIAVSIYCSYGGHMLTSMVQAWRRLQHRFNSKFNGGFLPLL